MISTVSKNFSNPPKVISCKKEVESDNEVESDIMNFKSKVSRGNIIMKELSKNNSLTSSDKLNAIAKNNIVVMDQINSFRVN